MCFEDYKPQFVEYKGSCLEPEEILTEQAAIRARVMNTTQDNGDKSAQLNEQNNQLKDEGTIFTIS